MSFLLDTNVLSETRRPRPDPGVTEWLASTAPHRLFVSALTIGEFQRGITLVRERGDERQAAALGSWLDDVVEAFADRVEPVTAAVARAWGRQRQDRPVAPVDALLAATATTHGHTLVTRNTKDFLTTGVALLNPFTG